MSTYGLPLYTSMLFFYNRDQCRHVSLASRWWHPSGALICILGKAPTPYSTPPRKLHGRDCRRSRGSTTCSTHSPPQLLPLLLRRQLHLLLLATERTPASLMLAILLLPSSYLPSTSLLGQRCAFSSRRPALLGPSVSRRCCSSSRRPVLPVMKALPPEVVAAYEQRFGVLGAAPAALPKGQVVPGVS